MTRTLSAIHAAPLWHASLSTGGLDISAPFPRPSPVGAMTPNKRYLVSR